MTALKRLIIFLIQNASYIFNSTYTRIYIYIFIYFMYKIREKSLIYNLFCKIISSKKNNL